MTGEDGRKQAEIDYPRAAGEQGRAWIRSKPFGHDPRETARLLIDFGYVLQLLDLHAGTTLCELGCGSGWMTRFAARHGVQAEGYDISPEMIEIARRKTGSEAAARIRFEVADVVALAQRGERFDLLVMFNMPPFFDAVARLVAAGGYVVWVAARGASTPFYTPEATLRRGFERRGLQTVAAGEAGKGTYYVAERRPA